MGSIDCGTTTRARQLIGELRDPTLCDEEIGSRLDELESILKCPRFSDIIFFGDSDLSGAEIIRKALEYRPFAL